MALKQKFQEFENCLVRTQIQEERLVFLKILNADPIVKFATSFVDHDRLRYTIWKGFMKVS
jgi:hypothetical protein